MNNSSNFQSNEWPGQKIDRDLEVRLHLERSFGKLRATLPWFSRKKLLRYLGIVVFFGVLFAASWPVHGYPDTFHQLVGLFLYPLLVLCGIYLTLTTLFNRTTLEASRESLSIHHGPLPWPGSRTIPRAELERLGIANRNQSSKGPITYSLEAWLWNAQKVQIWSQPERDSLDYLKQAIEQCQSSPVLQH
jgi:hypothetical protein